MSIGFVLRLLLCVELTQVPHPKKPEMLATMLLQKERGAIKIGIGVEILE